MSAPHLAPDDDVRGGLRSVFALWALAAVVAIAIGAIAPPDWRAAWMPVGMAGCIIVAFAVQLALGRPHGFIERVAASVLGALVVMGLIGLGLGLATMFSP